MNKTLAIFTIILIIGIMVVGTVSPAIATKDDNNGKAIGCETSNDNSKTRVKNSHCNTNLCNPNGDGAITVVELTDYLISQGYDSVSAPLVAYSTITLVELATTDLNNGLIDNSDELGILNNVYLTAFGIAACPGF